MQAIKGHPSSPEHLLHQRESTIDSSNTKVLLLTGRIRGKLHIPEKIADSQIKDKLSSLSSGNKELLNFLVSKSAQEIYDGLSSFKGKTIMLIQSFLREVHTLILGETSQYDFSVPILGESTYVYQTSKLLNTIKTENYFIQEEISPTQQYIDQDILPKFKPELIESFTNAQDITEEKQVLKEQQYIKDDELSEKNNKLIYIGENQRKSIIVKILYTLKQSKAELATSPGKNNKINTSKISFNNREISFIEEKEMERTVAGSIDKTKWFHITNGLFNSPIDESERVLDTLINRFGFIPEQVFSQPAFGNQNNFENIYAFLQLVRTKEKGEKEPQYKQVRTTYLKYLFLQTKNKRGILQESTMSKYNNSTYQQVYADINGVFIQILDPMTKNDMHGQRTTKIISHHIPYKYISTDLLNNWKKEGWVTDETYSEIKYEVEQAHGNTQESQSSKKNILSNIGALLHIQTNVSNNEISKEICRKLISNPIETAQVLYKNNTNIPYELLLHSKDINSDTYSFSLLEFAGEITALMGKEKVIEDLNNFKLDAKYILSKPRDSFGQKKNLLSKTVYDSINIALENKDSQDILYSYDLSTSNGKAMILGAISLHQDSSMMRAFIQNKERITNTGKKEIIELNQEQFKNIELFFDTHKIIKRQIDKIKNALNKGEALDEVALNNFYDSIIVLSLSYLPGEYRSLGNMIEQLRTSYNTTTLTTFLDEVELGLGILIEDWQEKIKTNSISNGIDNFGEIIKCKLDTGFLEKLKRAETAEDNEYDEELFQQGVEINLYETEWKDTDGNFSISGSQEFMAIQALGLDKSKPLVVISGGCKGTSKKDEENFYAFIKDELIEAIQKGANIAIVGNQSTAGRLASRALLEIQKSGKYSSRANSGKVFAISTGDELIYRDSDLKNAKHRFAPSPVDQIVLKDFFADWDKADYDILEMNFFKFVEWQSQFFNKLSMEGGKTHSVSNGGLFSIIEMMGSARNLGKPSAKMVFNKDGGRFSSAVSHLLSNIENHSELFLSLQDKSKTPIQYYNNLSNIDRILRDMPEEYYSEWKSKDFGDINQYKAVFQKLENESDGVEIKSNDKLFLRACKLVKEGKVDDMTEKDFKPKEFLYQLKFLEFISIIVSDSNKMKNVIIK